MFLVSTLCEVGTCIPIFTAEKTEVHRGAVTLPSSDNGDEVGLSFGLRSVRVQSPGSPGLLGEQGCALPRPRWGHTFAWAKVAGSGAVLGQGPEEWGSSGAGPRGTFAGRDGVL